MPPRTSDLDAVEIVILPRVRDLGDGFTVRRALPSAQRRMVGPFLFLDELGPTVMAPGQGLDVRPHPHIGLATVTWLFEGEIVHRDSLGSLQPIRPGEVNWMTAGRGIVHSERTGPEARAAGGPLLGLQTWVALPVEHEETAPSFAHHAAHELPTGEADGARLTVVVGHAHGLVSPVRTFSDTLFVQALLAPGATWQVRPEHEERAVFVIDGELEVVGQSGAFTAGELVVLRPGAEVLLRAPGGARAALLGGEAFPEPRHIWWNLVSSRPERIEQAKEDWREGRFPAVPGDAERIPLPER